MSEHGLYNEELPQRPEFNAIPEYSVLPEYNPVYPDVTFFRESSVTCREENVFQGRPPEGEPPRRDKRELRRKRDRNGFLLNFLLSAFKGGAAVLCAVAVVALLSNDPVLSRSRQALRIRDAFDLARRPAFTQQTGYETSDFIRLWNGNPDAPHQYDTEHPVITLAATCTETGEIEYVCLECGVRMHGVLPAAGHQPGDAEKHDEIAATCTEEGSYTETVICSVCGQMLKDETITVAATGHTPGAPVHTDETAPTCTEEGSYTESVTCSVCGAEISRSVVTTAATGHTESSPVRENETAATCTAEGSYDSVVYCSVCGEQISKSVVTTAATGHTESSPVRENETAATCTAEGSYDSVVYCSVCGEQMSSQTISIQALGHTAGQAVEENRSVADCTKGGTCEEVVYCSVCGEELSRTTAEISPADHTAGSTEKRWIYGREDSSGNITGPDCLDGGAYEEVTLCSVCGAEMAVSGEVQVDPPGHTYSKTPANGEVLRCSVCGMSFFDAFCSNNYVYYNVDTDYLSEAGLEYAMVRLWSYSAGAYINEGGYEFGSYGDIMVPDEYRNQGERFRVDFYFTNGNYISSSDVVYE